MVDWFNPVPDIGQPAVTKEVWRKKVGEIDTRTVEGDELAATLTSWLKMKLYTKPSCRYLVLCDFGLCFTFIKEARLRPAADCGEGRRLHDRRKGVMPVTADRVFRKEPG
jgi:hypothetical protein